MPDGVIDARGAARDGARVVGVDVARGLALLGMFAAHTSGSPAFDWSEPATWVAVADGRSSILFAVLAGVSVALMSGRTDDRGRRVLVAGRALVDVRMRILVRAVIVFVIGGVLTALSSGILVILEVYAVLFAASLLFLGWSARALLVAALVWVVAGSVVTVLARAGIESGAPAAAQSALVHFAVTGPYPALLWIAFLLAGMGVGRLPLASPRVATVVLVAGAALAALSYTAGARIEAASGAGLVELGGVPLDLADLATLEPHSGSPFEATGGMGFALAVIGVCLLAARARGAAIVLAPLAAVGAMPLTIYTAQVLAYAIAHSIMGEPPRGLVAFLAFAVPALVIAPIWRRLVGQGPLERMLAIAASRASDERGAAHSGW